MRTFSNDSRNLLPLLVYIVFFLLPNDDYAIVLLFHYITFYCIILYVGEATSKRGDKDSGQDRP